MMMTRLLPTVALCLVMMTVSTHALSDADAAELTTLADNGVFTSFTEGSYTRWQETYSYYTIESDGQPRSSDGTLRQDLIDQSFNGGQGSLDAQTYVFQFPKTPVNSTVQQCTPMGPIGFTVNNVVFFNLYTLKGGDANSDMMEMMEFGMCGGHPDGVGRYHTHGISSNTGADCLIDTENPDQLLGVALDGYPIYGPVSDGSGGYLTSADLGLDSCHGREESGEYRYRMTPDAPYIVGCFWGDTLYKTDSQRYRVFPSVTDIYCTTAPTTTVVPAKKRLLEVIAELNELKTEQKDLAEKKEKLEKNTRLVVKEALKPATKMQNKRLLKNIKQVVKELKAVEREENALASQKEMSERDARLVVKEFLMEEA